MESTSVKRTARRDDGTRSAGRSGNQSPTSRLVLPFKRACESRLCQPFYSSTCRHRHLPTSVWLGDGIYCRYGIKSVFEICNRKIKCQKIYQCKLMKQVMEY